MSGRDNPNRLKTIEELASLSDAELIALHDKKASENIMPRASYYLDELSRRRLERQNRRMEWLTVFIAILTVVNVVAVIVSL